MTAPSPVWTARTGSGLHPSLLQHGSSVAEDQPLVPWDLAGSIAHVLGLAKVGLIAPDEARELVTGLQQLHVLHGAGAFTLEDELEDVHMNVEAKLAEVCGAVAGKLHTGRSRNDQVALDLVLYTRSALLEMGHTLHQLASALGLPARTARPRSPPRSASSSVPTRCA